VSEDDDEEQLRQQVAAEGVLLASSRRALASTMLATTLQATANMQSYAGRTGGRPQPGRSRSSPAQLRQQQCVHTDATALQPHGGAVEMQGRFALH
jgi:hypothetical protein